MASYNCDPNSYFLIAIDFSHKTITFNNALKKCCFLYAVAISK